MKKSPLFECPTKKKKKKKVHPNMAKLITTFLKIKNIIKFKLYRKQIFISDRS